MCLNYNCGKFCFDRMKTAMSRGSSLGKSIARPSASKIYACDFEIHGNVPKEAFELFAVAQARILGVRGYIIQVRQDLFKGLLQGETKLIENFKQLIETASEYMGVIKEFIIKNMKAIENYTYQAFEVKNK